MSNSSIIETTIDYINQNSLAGINNTLTYTINTTNGPMTELQTVQIACRHMETGIFALVGPSSSNAVKSIIPVITNYHIPLLAPVATDPTLTHGFNNEFLIRMSPSDTIQSEALIAIIEKYKWRNMNILTSSSDYGVHGLIQFQIIARRRGWNIYSVQQFTIPASGNVSDINVHQQLKVMKSHGGRIIILHCIANFAIEILKQAETLGMTWSGWTWISIGD